MANFGRILMLCKSNVLYHSRCLITPYSTFSIAARHKNLLRVTNVNVMEGNCRNFIGDGKEINERVEKKLKKTDGIPEDYSIVYRAPWLRYLKTTYALSFASVLLLPCIVTVSYMTNEGNTFPVTMGNHLLINNNWELCGFVLGLTVIVFQLGVIVFNYPIRAYSDPKSKHYILIFQDFLPWKNKKMDFISGDLKKCETSISPWRDSMYVFKGKKALLLENYFRKPSDLNSMLKQEEIIKKEK